MSIYKVNQDLPNNIKIRDLNDMILENGGRIASAQFDKNEIAEILDAIGLDRKFSRDVSLGHTVGTYTEWSHVKEESGYSIWKIQPSDYAYNNLNQLNFDGKLVENRGQADSETLTGFDLVYLYDGASYNDHSAEAATEGGTPFTLMQDTNDFLYLGISSIFEAVSFKFSQRGSNYTLAVEYWNGSAWTDLTVQDDTDDFSSNGKITFTAPGDWAQTSVNGQTKYWIRIKTSTVPVTSATAYLIVPGTSVPAMLALSALQVQQEQWAWCSYNGYIYVTIRNIGQPAYEGNYFINSASSETNKENFFVHNHEFSADYEDSTYSANPWYAKNIPMQLSWTFDITDSQSNKLIARLPTNLFGQAVKITKLSVFVDAAGSSSLSVRVTDGTDSILASLNGVQEVNQTGEVNIAVSDYVLIDYSSGTETATRGTVTITYNYV